uniref:Uncharacterized protein n=1 Tax=Rhizophora mucronata TaxID=61149 RepID=A0A2P2J3K3_RHIMU
MTSMEAGGISQDTFVTHKDSFNRLSGKLSPLIVP